MTDSGQEANLRKSRTGFQDETGTWYALDNAGTIMPAVSNSVATSLFRISAELDEAVNLADLEAALAAVSARFPYFAVDLKRGLFWYYLEPHQGPLRVEADTDSPSQAYDINRRGRCLFRVRAKGGRIACEFSHALSDGTGGMRLFKNLLVEYFRRRGVGAPPPGEAPDPDLYDLGARPDPEEYEDAYNRHFSEEYPVPERLPRAFHIKCPQLPRHRYRITCGIVPLAPALAKAKEYGASITEMFAAAFLEALQEIWLAAPPAELRRQRPHLSVEIPVNMRKFFPTKSNRNFSLFVLVTQNMKLGKRDFPEMVERAHHQLRYEIDSRNIARQISRNVSNSRKMAVRLVPLVLKDFFAPFLFNAFGEDLLSGFISNIGPASLPAAVAERVRRFDFIPAPSVYNKTNASVVSWKGNLYINFGSLARSRELERLFFRRLVSLGLPVRIECNM
jgi:hypothetical protein